MVLCGFIFRVVSKVAFIIALPEWITAAFMLNFLLNITV